MDSKKEPISLRPWFVAMAVLVGLLLLHGLFCEVGLVMYF
jgi:hypothetical protein